MDSHMLVVSKRWDMRIDAQGTHHIRDLPISTQEVAAARLRLCYAPLRARAKEGEERKGVEEEMSVEVEEAARMERYRRQQPAQTRDEVETPGAVPAPILVHQLDSATSGVTLFALHKDAATALATAFAHRIVRKEYEALLWGDVDLGALAVAARAGAPVRARAGDAAMPELDEEDGGSIFPMGTPALFALEAGARAGKSHREVRDALSASCSLTPLNAAEMAAVTAMRDPGPVLRSATRSATHTGTQTGTAGALGGEVAHSMHPPSEVAPSSAPAPEAAADETSPPVPDAKEASEEELDVGSAAGSAGGGGDDDGPAGLLISAPIAPVGPRDFRMCVGALGKEKVPVGRSADTVLTVVGRGTLDGRAVTHVRLFPISGRRHQLRVHCASIGHPIVNDLTYEAPLTKSFALTDPAGDEKSDCLQRSAADRMMLHSRRLWLGLDSSPAQRQRILRRRVVRRLLSDRQQERRERAEDDDADVPPPPKREEERSPEEIRAERRANDRKIAAEMRKSYPRGMYFFDAGPAWPEFPRDGGRLVRTTDDKGVTVLCLGL